MNHLEKDPLWQYKLFLNEGSRDFYDNPVNSAHLSGKTAVSGYWNFPFRILKNGDPMITYTLPLIDKTGNVWGITGIATSVPYYTSLLDGSNSIHALARQVRESDPARHRGFQKSPYREINDMAAAIEHAGQVYLDSTSRFLQIISSINLPLGIFFYSHDGERGYVSDYLMRLLSPPDADSGRQQDIIKHFPAIPDRIMSRPLEGETDVYCLENPEKYYVIVKCFKNEQDVLGIIEDVTASILEKKIHMERDCDFLTSLCSRFYFEKQ